MRDGNLAPAALVDAIVCCGATALFAGLVGGIALAAIGQLTAISLAGLCVVVVIAWRLDRRQHRHGDRTEGTNDRPAQVEETSR